MVELTGRTWALVRLGDDVVPGDLPARSRPRLTFDGDGQVYGTGGVNRLRGTYALDGAGLRFGPLATTMMAGVAEHMAREAAFLAFLDGELTVHEAAQSPDAALGAVRLTDAAGTVAELHEDPAGAPGTVQV